MTSQVVRLVGAAVLSVALLPADTLAGDVRALSLELSILSPEIGPMDPLHFRLKINNKGDQELTALAPWDDYRYTVVEYQAVDSEEWMNVRVPELWKAAYDDSPYQAPSFAIGAGSSESIQCAALFVNAPLNSAKRPKNLPREAKYIYYFDEPGLYRVRAKYRPKEGVVIPSDIEAFRVVPYEGVDAEAYEWLKTRRIPHFMYDPLVGGALYLEDGVPEDVRTLIDRFPNSRFAPWAKLLLAEVAFRRGKRERPNFARQGPRAVERVQRLWEKARRLTQSAADTGDPHLQELAHQLLDEIAEAEWRERRRKQSAEELKETKEQIRRQQQRRSLELAAADNGTTENDDGAEAGVGKTGSTANSTGGFSFPWRWAALAVTLSIALVSGVVIYRTVRNGKAAT